MCELTGMDVANAGAYYGGSALAEAILMARAIRGKGFTKDEIIFSSLEKRGYTDLNRREDFVKDSKAYAFAVQYRLVGKGGIKEIPVQSLSKAIYLK